MKPTNLREALEARSPEDTICQFGARSLEAGEALSTRLAFVEGVKRVALCLQNVCSLVECLAMLDGRVTEILLLPPAGKHVQASLLSDFGPDLAITDIHGSRDGWTHLSGLQSEDRTPDDANTTIDTRWVFATSGTTDTPKLVVQSFENLIRTVRQQKAEKAQLRWALFYDPARFAGMQVLLQAIVGGGCALMPDQVGSFADHLAYFVGQNCNAFSATPSMWRKILMTPGHERLNPSILTLGGEIADQPVLESLRLAYPQARIAHVYASTEAGTGFVVADGQAGFPTSLLDTGFCGTSVRVRDGRLMLKNPGRAARYLNADTEFSDQDGYVDTGDCVTLSGSRYLFLGRANGAINVGGNKVFPEEVEEAIMASGFSRAAKVSGKSSPVLGSIVVAEVVLGHGISAQDGGRLIKRFCSGRLEPWKVPAVLRFVDSLSLGPAGKVIR